MEALLAEAERRVHETKSARVRNQRQDEYALLLAYVHTGDRRNAVLAWQWGRDVDLEGGL